MRSFRSINLKEILLGRVRFLHSLTLPSSLILSCSPSDLARKFLQMGYTRAMRYYNNKGGTKPAGTTEGRTNYRSASRKAKAEAADDSDGEEEDGGGEKEEKEAAFVPTGEVAKKDCAEAFKVYWRRVVDEDEVYGRMKKDWMKNEGKSAKEEVE